MAGWNESDEPAPRPVPLKAELTCPLCGAVLEPIEIEAIDHQGLCFRCAAASGSIWEKLELAKVIRPVAPSLF